MQTSLAIRESIAKVADILVYVGVYFVSAAVLVASADWRLCLPFLGWLAAYVGICIHFVPKLQKIAEAQAEARSVMTGRVVDSYTNILTVKLFAHTSSEDDYARESMDIFLATVHRQMRQVTVLNLLLSMLNYLLLFATVVLAIQLWLLHAVTPGNIAVAIALAQRLQSMSQWILWELGALFENIGTVQDGMQTVSRPRTVLDAAEAPPLQVTQGAIRFERSGFHYGRQNRVITDLDLDIRPGERVGLVGPSGAGKSTLTSLLLRLYDLEAGRILIDGQDISLIAQESLRAAIGVVTQDTALLHRSVRENIAYGRPEATEEDVTRATHRAHAYEFIMGLKDGHGRAGFDAHVGERGVSLSGGQRQRIAIARVLLKDAPILVLDEATSALDSEIEAAIQESLSELMTGKTVIAIAHRLSTIARMDRLVVLDQGRIVETGRHEELVARQGLYARLWARQTGGFITD
jgi:ATP-binding cassette subfamily B multidrug efflux pump